MMWNDSTQRISYGFSDVCYRKLYQFRLSLFQFTCPVSHGHYKHSYTYMYVWTYVVCGCVGAFKSYPITSGLKMKILKERTKRKLKLHINICLDAHFWCLNWQIPIVFEMWSEPFPLQIIEFILEYRGQWQQKQQSPRMVTFVLFKYIKSYYFYVCTTSTYHTCSYAWKSRWMNGWWPYVRSLYAPNCLTDCKLQPWFT